MQFVKLTFGRIKRFNPDYVSRYGLIVYRRPFYLGICGILRAYLGFYQYLFSVRGKHPLIYLCIIFRYIIRINYFQFYISYGYFLAYRFKTSLPVYVFQQHIVRYERCSVQYKITVIHSRCAVYIFRIRSIFNIHIVFCGTELFGSDHYFKLAVFSFRTDSEKQFSRKQSSVIALIVFVIGTVTVIQSYKCTGAGYKHMYPVIGILNGISILIHRAYLKKQSIITAVILIYDKSVGVPE